jgi:branched-chain amino acid transport system substrate-binding protein
MKRLGIFALIMSHLMVGYAGQRKRFFKIGVVTSLSGELAFGGTVTKRGYDMWKMLSRLPRH